MSGEIEERRGGGKGGKKEGQGYNHRRPSSKKAPSVREAFFAARLIAWLPLQIGPRESPPASQEKETNKIENLPLEEQSKVQRISAPGCEARGGGH